MITRGAEKAAHAADGFGALEAELDRLVADADFDAALAIGNRLPAGIAFLDEHAVSVAHEVAAQDFG